jgi:hypothetical protein
MKKNLMPLLTVVLLFCVMIMNAENGKGSKSSIPYKSPNSVLYGKDIIMNNVPSQNQRNVHVSVAFNGWLFAVYTHSTSTNSGYGILKSIDNGITWTVISDVSYPGAYTAAGVVVAGNNLSDLKLFVAGIVEHSASSYTVWCDRRNAQTGDLENEFFSETSTNQIYDLAIASDYRYPEYGITPYSLGIVFSKSSTLDSVILVTSDDGGYTIGSRNVVATTNMFFRKVAISYGICNSYDEGRYFVAWEEMETHLSTMGHIWTGYTDPLIFDPIINKVKLDSMYSAYYNVCFNPAISTQFNSSEDNSSGNLSEIVLFDGNYNPGDNDLLGMYNVQAVGTGIASWQQFYIAASYDDEMESDINFDPIYNNFLVTYFDSTTQQLPYIINNMNLVDPYNWTEISAGYNDSSNLSYPYPKVQTDQIFNKVVNVWSAEGSGGGVGMFDAEFSTYTGISQIHQSDVATLEGAYPNPAATKTSIGFTLNNQAEVIINLYSIFGQEIKLITDQSFNPGKNIVDVDVSNLPEGTYIYSLKAKDFTASGRIIVIR